MARKLTEEQVKAAADRAEGKAVPPHPDRGERPPGRPSKYSDKYPGQAEKLALLGATDIEIARFFDVSLATLKNWKVTYPEFLASLKDGKNVWDNRIERSLYERAMGYTFESEKIFQFQGEVVRAKTIEHVPPDVTACIFWLKNRRPADWREKMEHLHDLMPGLGERLAKAIQRSDDPIVPLIEQSPATDPTTH